MFYLEPSSSMSRSSPINLSLHLKRLGLNLSSPTQWQGDVYSTVVLCVKNCFMRQGNVEGGGFVIALKFDMWDISYQVYM
jgi:hypothetical protein